MYFSQMTKVQNVSLSVTKKINLFSHSPILLLYLVWVLGEKAWDLAMHQAIDTVLHCC
jgi:hypothetical protein